MPAHLILVHGEANNMSRLRSALKTKFGERKDDIQIYTPRNVEIVKLKFRGERMAKVGPFRVVASHLRYSCSFNDRSGPRDPCRDNADSRVEPVRAARLEGLHLHLPRPFRSPRLHRPQHQRDHAATTHHGVGHVGPRPVAPAGHVRQDPAGRRRRGSSDDAGAFRTSFLRLSIRSC